MQFEVHLVDYKREIGYVYGDEELAAVSSEPWGAMLRFRVTGANEDAIKDGL